ncbi:MAG: alpha-N-arabinofuranosidase [Bifidobacteriaceae bacterium]|nr:alpha-N-arabinofuranosidase [Bifidobacteriaceae bacterium]
MIHATVKADRAFAIGRTDPRLFSSFVEHLGRAVYTGIYEPGHPSADASGFRADVIELVRDLGISHVRYPGGNFLSSYDWWDGVGPREARPTRLDLAWHSIESNRFGWGEFAAWSKAAGTEIMGAVNLGTGTPKQAGELLEYTNFRGGTELSDRRVAHGHREPWNVRLWCLGNEMDGEWQLGRATAREYGAKAREAAKIMRRVDPSIELVACGSSTALQPTFPEWDRVVLEETYEQVDYLSLHRYYEHEGSDLDFLASFVDMDRFIGTLAATADYVRALKRCGKRVDLSFDEWNVWYQTRQSPHPWQEAPALLEDEYTLLDALVLAGLGMTLINRADRVRIACLAQLVNVIAPIRTQAGGPAIRQSIYHPFRSLSRHGRGLVLAAAVDTPTLETKYGDAPAVHTGVVLGSEGLALTVFCLNISAEAARVEIDLRGVGSARLFEHTVLDGPQLQAANTFARPNAVSLRRVKASGGPATSHSLELPPRSFHTLRFELA